MSHEGNTREKAVEAMWKSARSEPFDQYAALVGFPTKRDEVTERAAHLMLDALIRLGWSPSPVPMVDREALKAELRSIYGANLSEMNDWDADADAILASNILRPFPSEKEIAEAIYVADEAWYAEDPKSSRGLSVRAWSRWMAKRVLALLRGEKR